MSHANHQSARGAERSANVPEPNTARERLLETAARLFYGRGINSTGVDLILAESKVAKGSLYHHFAGKQALVLAYLQRERDDWEQSATARDDPKLDAGARLDTFFSGVIHSVHAGTFHGCPFTNAIIERPEDAEVRAAVDGYCEQLRQHLAAITGESPTSTLVQQLFVVYNGALTALKLTRDLAAVERARGLAQQMLHGQQGATTPVIETWKGSPSTA